MPSVRQDIFQFPMFRFIQCLIFGHDRKGIGPGLTQYAAVS